MRVPLAPIGWPIAMAPPFTLSRSSGTASSRPTATACAANASLSSKRSMSRSSTPALCNAERTAGTGPIPMIRGATPALEYPRIRARGTRFSDLARDSLITTTAAAPSLMPLALPAVTVPSLANAARSMASDSVVVPARRCAVAGAGVLVGVDEHLLLLALHRHGNDLIPEPAALDRSLRLLLRPGRENILI